MSKKVGKDLENEDKVLRKRVRILHSIVKYKQRIVHAIVIPK